jgi:hypothetical protein
MTVPRDPDAILASWLAEGPTRLPEVTRRSIVVATRTTRQTRRPMWTPWRLPVMNGASRLALAPLVLVAVALGGLYLFTVAPGGVVGPSPSPTPTPRPFPTDTSGGVPVEPGTYALVLPAPTPGGAALRVIFTMPAGWEKNLTPTSLWQAVDHRRIGFFTVDNLYRDPCLPANGLLVPPLGPSVDDLIAGLGGLPGVTSSSPPATIALAIYRGQDIVLTAASDLTPCADESLVLWTSPQGAVTANAGAVLQSDERGRIVVVDVDGTRLAITRSYGPTASAADLAEMQAIVDSVRIERVEPPTSPGASPGAS